MNGFAVNTLKLSLAGNTGGFSLQNAIENVRILQNQTATLSLWARDLNSTPFTVSVLQFYGPTITAFSQQYQASSDWTQYKGSFLMPALSTTADGKIVGFMESDPQGSAVFKIKEDKASAATSDLRTKNRGAVCETRSKSHLQAIINALVPLVKKSESWQQKRQPLPSSAVVDELKMADICRLIKLMLLSLEEDAQEGQEGRAFVRVLND